MRQEMSGLLLSMRSYTWREVKPAGTIPRGRYGHALLPLSPDSALLFGGESGTGITNDTWILSGLSAAAGAAGSVPTVARWEPLEAGGAVPAVRKGHAAASAWCHKSLACIQGLRR